MLKKTLVSPIALAFGLMLSGAAAAQTWVGDQEVSDADLSAVQAYCNELQAEANLDGEVTTGPEDFESSDSDVGTPMGAIDLTTITIDDCREAGLIN